MVFGFGRKKPVEVPAGPVQKERDVSLSEIPSLIRELEVPRTSRLVQESRRLKTEMEACQKNIHEIVLQLESDDLKLDDVDKNLRTLGKRGKDAVVSTIKKETRTKLNSIEAYEDAIGLNNEAAQMLKRMGDILGLHTRVMHVFARKYADKLKEEISDLAQNRDMLQNMISEQERFRSDANAVLETIKKIEDLGTRRAQAARRINETLDEKAETIKTVASAEAEISGMKAMPEYRQFLETRKMIEDQAREKVEIRERIGSQFSKISRPLNKYSYVSSFDKPMKKLMDELIADPYEVISPENRGPIVEILQAVTKSVVAGNVSVKDSDRSAEQVEETIEMLDEFLGLKVGYAKRLAELESGLGVFDYRRLEEKEALLEKSRSHLADLESSRARLEAEIGEIRSEGESLKHELGKMITRLSGDEIVARIQS